jgi:prepilin-type N-terminal cleavage/methylation domain-containing protein
MLKPKLILRSWLQLLNLMPNLTKSAAKDSGFTLVESIVAAVVVGILLVSIAPMLVISTASRIQARRVDSANNLARDFADRLKAGTVPPFPPYVFTASSYTNFSTTYPNYSGVFDTVFKNVNAVDGNSDGKFDGASDLVIQAIRTPNNAAVGNDTILFDDATAPTKLKALQDGGYEVLIRVYRGDAFGFTNVDARRLNASGSDPFAVYSALLSGTPDFGIPQSTTTQLQSTFTGGTGSSSRHRPLAIFRTTVQYNVDFNSLRTRLGS